LIKSWVVAADERPVIVLQHFHEAEERRFGEAELIPESDAER